MSNERWLPLGPSTVVDGFAESQPRVTGRVRDIAVSLDGKRIYVAAAGGGVWYSDNEGSTWTPVGNWMPTPSTRDMISPANALSCGCLLVDFGATAAADVVYVGTGELTPEMQKAIPAGWMGGVGVLHLTTPVSAAQNPFANPWTREAQNLTGFGIFRLASDPRNKKRIVAATSKGLFFRAGEGAAWTELFVTNPDGSGIGMFPNDVVWLPGGRLWVAETGNTDADSLLRFADTSVTAAPAFTTGSKVQLAGAVRGRLTMGTFRQQLTNPQFIYILGTGPHLWRVENNSAKPVTGLPPNFFTTSAGDQSFYDSAITVHPDHQDIIVVGGAGHITDGDENANLYRFKITASGSAVTTDFQSVDDQTYIGRGVHPDVHQIAYAGPERSLWVSCDGGVFRSRSSGAPQTFVAVNSGLPVIQTGYVANHPVNDAFVIAGSQDNGLLIRVGDTVWFPFIRSSDAGGVMFHPTLNTLFFGQVTQSEWQDSRTTLPHPVERPGAPATTETTNALFYSGGDIRLAGTDVHVAIGTNRVWYLKNWKDKIWKPGDKNPWVTLPSGTDPLVDSTGKPRRDTGTDTYGGGTGQIVSCRWMRDDRLIVLMRSVSPNGVDSAVLLLEDKHVTAWDRTELSKGNTQTTPFPNLPPVGGWSDIGIHDPGRGRYGSFYVACTGLVTRSHGVLTQAAFDTLYWFDGDQSWFPTTLRTANHSPDNIGTPAPAYAVVCDPDHKEIVYVGTAVGVWQGTLTFTGNTPGWKWRPFSTNLPQLAVQDLAIYSHGSVKLLRAATQSRGIWEVDLGTAVPTPVPFLGVHANDSRRQLPTPLDNPTDRGPHPWVWFASPDIRIRPAAGGAVVKPPKSIIEKSWTRRRGNFEKFDLWTFQTALRKKDARCRPTGDWTPQMDDCVHKLHAAGDDTLTITRAMWDSIVTQADAFAEPWDGEPSEADLFELIVEESAVKRDDYKNDKLSGPPRKAYVHKRKYKIDVLVHYRDLTPLATTKVKVTLLLRQQVSKSDTTVPTVAIPPSFSAGVAQLITGSSPTLPDNWKVAEMDATNVVRFPNANVDVTTPRVVTFDVDFSNFAEKSEFALLAIVHRVPDSGTDPGPTLSGATLDQLVLGNAGAAARVVVVKA